MQGLMNMVGGSAGTRREGGQSSGQPGSYYSRPETTASYETVQTTSTSYAPPSVPLPPSVAYAPSSHAQHSQSGSSFHPPPAQSQYAPSYVQPSPPTSSFVSANSAYMQNVRGAPGGYPSARPSGGYPPLSPNVPFAGGYPSARPTSGYPPPSTFPPAGDYSISHHPRVGDFSQPSDPPPGGFGPSGFPDEHRGIHGHEFPEAPVYGGRYGQHAFDNDDRRGDQQQASFPSPAGYPPRNDPYDSDNRW